MKTLKTQNQARKASGETIKVSQAMRDRLPFFDEADFAAVEKEKQPTHAEAVQVILDYLESQADGPARCKEDARDAGRAIHAVELLENSIRITPENLARAKEVADLLEGSVEDYINQTLSDYLSDIYENGKLGEIEVMTRNFDTKAEALRIAEKADVFDNKVGWRKWYVMEAVAPKYGKFELDCEFVTAKKAA